MRTQIAAQLATEETIRRDFSTGLSLEHSIAFLEQANELYRAGTPMISDQHYDWAYEETKKRAPDHEFFNTVEPEGDAFEGKTVTLSERMLSTDKAYDFAKIQKWVDMVLKCAEELGIPRDRVLFKVMTKLDGYAALDAEDMLCTRGNGYRGTDITHAVPRLNTVLRGQGKGEIVINKQYFADNLAEEFDNSRNVIAGIIKDGDVSPFIQKAIDDKAIIFMPFGALPYSFGSGTNILAMLDPDSIERLWKTHVEECEYEADGLVFQVEHLDIRDALGSTSHHHRWQIAYKRNLEFANIKVLDVIGQTSKTGRITPVALLEPTPLSGVTVSRATAHHYGNVIAQGIGPGAEVLVCRSGAVIPKIEKVEVPGLVLVPDACPSCGAMTEMRGDHLFCTNTATCPAQKERTLEYFFKTLGNCDGFGPSTLKALVDSGVVAPSDIYNMLDVDMADVVGITFGVAKNLLTQLERSRREPIEDWRFLAAFGISGIGKGGCERLLKHHKLKDVFNLRVIDFMQIDGFGELSSIILCDGLHRIKPEFDYLMRLGFNLIETPLASETKIDSPIAGKTVVFTGSMQQGSRDDMKRQAKGLGATVTESVTRKTDYLVCGANVGAAKVNAAEKNGITVLSESDYLKLLEVTL